MNTSRLVAALLDFPFFTLIPGDCKMKLALAHIAMVLSLAFAAHIAHAGNIYTEDFDPLSDGLNGWSGDSPVHQASGGVGNSAFLQTTRTGFSPQNRPDPAQPTELAALNLLGDLESLYGTQFTISYYGKVFNAGTTSTELRHTARNNSTGPNASWSYQLHPGPNAATIAAAFNDWQYIEIPVDTTWTNAEAIDNGWRLDIAGLDFSDIWSNVTVHEFMTGSGNGGTKSYGIDDVRVESVPEPSSIIAFGIVGVGALLGASLLRRRARVTNSAG